MTRPATALRPALDLPMPARVEPKPLDAILARSAEVISALPFLGGDRPGAGTLSRAIPPAERFLVECAAQAPALRDAMAPMSETDVTAELMRFVSAWPNASGGDLAGYGAQLLQDVVDRKPCRYAMREATRKLRHGSRFLPSIAEVLAALDEAQGRIRNTASHIARLPERLEHARAVLVDAERWEARLETQRQARAKEPGAFCPDD